jgi:hypothetical protein
MAFAPGRRSRESDTGNTDGSSASRSITVDTAESGSPGKLEASDAAVQGGAAAKKTMPKTKPLVKQNESHDDHCRSSDLEAQAHEDGQDESWRKRAPWRVKVNVTFTPVAGTTQSIATSVTLKLNGLIRVRTLGVDDVYRSSARLARRAHSSPASRWGTPPGPR